MKTLLFAITLHLLLSSFLLAQEKVDIQMIQKIKDEELQHSQIVDLSGFKIPESDGTDDEFCNPCIISKIKLMNLGLCRNI